MEQDQPTPAQLSSSERFHREVLWRAQREAELPAITEIDQYDLERLQRKTFELAVRHVMATLCTPAAGCYHPRVAEQLEKLYVELKLIEP